MPFSTCLPEPEIESTSLTSLALAGKIFTTSTTWEALSSPLVFSIFSFLLLPPWRRKWKPTPVLLPGKSHGWRILVGYSPWGRKELDMTERLHFPSSWLPLFSSARDTFPRVLHRLSPDFSALSKVTLPAESLSGPSSPSCVLVPCTTNIL